MFKKFFSQKTNFLLATVLAFFELSSVALATDSTSDAETKMKWLKDRSKSRPSHANIVVLGPKDNGKSTLINLLIHTSEYATRAKNGHVLVDFEDQMEPIYHKDIFRFDVTKSVKLQSYKATTLPEEFKDIPSIDAFVPVLGPIPVKDFMKHVSQTSLLDHETEAEKMVGGTEHPHVYRSNSKVTSPVFLSTFVDAPGIGDQGRLIFVKRVIEKAPSDKINAILLVVSGKELTNGKFKPDTFAYFKEVAEFLKHVDPTFARVQLAVTHAANDQFQTAAANKPDPRRVVSEQFLKVTGILVNTSKVFFFENQFNCLSDAAIDSLYSCQTGNDVSAGMQHAFQHRQKNYQLNLLESFNLLKDASKSNPVSRFEILNRVRAAITEDLGSGQIGKNVNVGPKSYIALGSLTLPEGNWQITASSSYSGHHGNAYYMHNVNTKPNSEEGVTLGIDYFIGTLAREQGIGAAPTMIKVVRLTQTTTFYLNVKTQLYLAGIGGILGSLTAVRLLPSEN